MIIKKKKLIVTFFALFFVFILSNSKAYAVEFELPLDYQMILDDVNSKYSLDLTVSFTESNYMSVNEFKNFIEDIAKQQRQLLDYIEERKSVISDDIIYSEMNTIATEEYKKVEKLAQGSDIYMISCFYYASGNRVTTVDSFGVHSIDWKYTFDWTDGSYKRLDGYRTVAITIKGVSKHLGTSVGNITLYQEFYHSDKSNV